MRRAHHDDGSEADDHDDTVNEIGHRRADEPSEGRVDDDHRRSDEDRHPERDVEQRGKHGTDHEGFENVDDQVFGLYTQTRQDLATLGSETLGEGLTDGVQTESSERDRKEEADQPQREKGVDAVPEVPETVGHDVAGHTIGANSTDPGSGDADGDHQETELPTADRPAGRTLQPARNPASEKGRTHEIDGDDENGTHSVTPDHPRRVIPPSIVKMSPVT